MELHEIKQKIEFVELQQATMKSTMQAELKAIRENTEKTSEAVSSIAITLAEFRVSMQEFTRLRPKIEKIDSLEMRLNQIEKSRTTYKEWAFQAAFWTVTTLLVYILWKNGISVATINNR